MEKQFKCKDEILYRYNHSCTIEEWRYGIVSHYKGNILILIGTMIDLNYYDIIPYKDNEHLAGTKDDAEEKIELSEVELIVCNDYLEQLKQGIGTISYFKCIDNNKLFVSPSGFSYKYFIRFEDYMNSNNYKDNILIVKNNKIVKLK